MKNLLKVLAVAGVFFAISTNANAQSGTLIFKEGNGGTQNTVATITDASGQFYNLKDKTPSNIGANDEAKSLILQNVRVGAAISVYDAPAGDASDDYCIITVKSLVSSITVSSFETSYEDANVKVDFHHHNGLDGKVSAIRVN
ncbi:hypothetical protein [Pedobacter sp. L105]|uniref:hypothetical protein n=1 Tax=Pedobacter sp. L105 TaxID=1641871 RepID=UPI00131AD866|nr:hypothetical protein [Pedobacter sp. L105]